MSNRTRGERGSCSLSQVVLMALMLLIFAAVIAVLIVLGDNQIATKKLYP